MRTPLFLLIDSVARDELQPPRRGHTKPRSSKRKKLLIAALLVIAAVAAPIGVANAGSKPSVAGGQSRNAYAPGEVIVKFRDGQAPTARSAALRAHGARVARALWKRGPVLVNLPAGASVTDAVAALKRDPRVEYAQPNVYRQAFATPNDPLFAEQWMFHNTGQIVNQTQGVAGAGIHTPEAWDRTTGSQDVKVAVIDSGVTFTAPDLAPNLWHNPGETGDGKESNGVDDDHNGFVDDWRGWDFVQGDNEPLDNHGHGTAVTSILAARGNDGVGIAGTTWKASVIPVRALDNDAGAICDELASALAYAVKVGARIVNFSGGGVLECKPEEDAIAAAPNVLFVVAAGNQGVDVDKSPVYPCVDPAPNLICVGGTDSTDRIWEHSNFGSQSVDLAAPAVNLLATWPKWDPQQDIFKDGFEEPLELIWEPLGTPNTWARTKTGPRSGSWALTDSPNGDYADNTDNYVYLEQLLDLRGKHDCYANVFADLKMSPVATEPDLLWMESSSDGIHWDRRQQNAWGVTGGYRPWQYELSELEGRSSLGHFRFHLTTNDFGSFDGAYLDDFSVSCIPPSEKYSGARDEFDYSVATSFATPQVSGVAALLLSLDPSLSAVDLKQRIMSSVDPLPTLSGRTVSGGRLNAAKAVATIPVPPKTTPASPATSALASDLQALVKKLRVRALLRGFVASGVHAPGAGRLALVVKSGKRTVASGSRTVKRAGTYAFRVRATKRGRALLRHSRHLQVTVELSFKPKTGAAVKQSAKLRLR
jgi:subtilisin family serine protease